MEKRLWPSKKQSSRNHNRGSIRRLKFAYEHACKGMAIKTSYTVIQYLAEK